MISLIVFLSGASVMMMEIAGARVIAPYVGNSLPAWTALISVVLGSLSIGYAVGGRLADKYPSYTILSVLLFLSALTIVFIKPLEFVFLPLVRVIDDIRYLALVFSLGLFALPSVLLGMISPYAIKLSLRSLSNTGKTAGNLTALSTMGSIVGTVVTGFYLLGTVGHATVLFLVSGILVFCGILAWMRGKNRHGFFLIPAFLPFVVIHDVYGMSHPLGKEYDTPYQRLFIQEWKDPLTNRPVRMLLNDVYGVQSAMFLDHDDDLVAEYLKVFRVADDFAPVPQRVLVIGGAGYSYPKDVLRRNQQTRVDVVEIDPGMTRVARQWFNLKDTERLSIHHDDGRIFLQKTHHVYDVMYFDAFGELITSPFHLLTREMFSLAQQRLSYDGVFVMNVIAGYEGRSERFFSSLYATVNAVFPFIRVYRVGNEPDNEMQNIVILASMKDFSFVDDSAWQRRDFHPSSDAMVFIDSFAPVEQYAMDMLR
ncbi:MAG: fused MFS/spermidine synthase [Patescibacteria group bacterium]|nr:fused MFS/spermidine synthase [Patescibacteria group bacterium]